MTMALEGGEWSAGRPGILKIEDQKTKRKEGRIKALNKDK
jgi:hypothetical protein